MESCLRHGFVLRDEVKWTRLDNSFVFRGRIECQGGILIDVKKLVVILDHDGADLIVQTRSYTYNATLGGRNWTIVRYDSPHPHFPYHHVHRFKTGVQMSRDILSEEERPTLSEVVRELEMWYYDNADLCHSDT